MAQWIARWTSNPEAVGSSPSRGTYLNGIIKDNKAQHVVDIGYTFKITYCARNHAALRTHNLRISQEDMVLPRGTAR